MKQIITLKTCLYVLLGLLVLTSIACNKDKVDPDELVNDIDGNKYHSVKIGNQTWMKENLKTTTFNDGSAIPNVITDGDWAQTSTEAYCWYNNDEINKDPYGALYNYHAATSGKLCPKGWHVPTNEDWDVLISTLGGEDVAGGKLKEEGKSHWTNPNIGATNESGFTALPGGNRGSDGSFFSLGIFGIYRSSSGAMAGDKTWTYDVNTHDSSISKKDLRNTKFGLSVRCIKDE